MKKVLELSFFYAVASCISVGTTAFISNNVPPDIYAILGVYNWVLGLLSALCLLSLPAVIRVYFTSDSYIGVVKTTFFFCVSLFLLLASFIIIFPDNFSHISKLEASWSTALIIGILYFILMSYCQTIFQCEDRFSLFGLLMILRPGLLCFFALLLLDSDNRTDSLLSVVNFTQVVSLILMLVVFIKVVGIQNPFSLSQSLEVFKFVGPLVPHTVLGYLALGIDRYLATLFLTAEEVGIYFLIFTYCFMLSVIGDIGTKIYQNWLYRALADKSISQSQINGKVRWLLCLVLIFVPLAYYGMGFVFKLLLPQEYLSGLSLYPFFVLGIAFSFIYLIYIQFVVFLKRTEILPIITGVSLAVSCVSGIALYQHFDLGVYSFVIGYVLGQVAAAGLAYTAAQYYLKNANY